MIKRHGFFASRKFGLEVLGKSLGLSDYFTNFIVFFRHAVMRNPTEIEMSRFVLHAETEFS